MRWSVASGAWIKLSKLPDLAGAAVARGVRRDRKRYRRAVSSSTATITFTASFSSSSVGSSDPDDVEMAMSSAVGTSSIGSARAFDIATSTSYGRSEFMGSGLDLWAGLVRD